MYFQRTYCIPCPSFVSKNVEVLSYFEKSKPYQNIFLKISDILTIVRISVRVLAQSFTVTAHWCESPSFPNDQVLQVCPKPQDPRKSRLRNLLLFRRH